MSHRPDLLPPPVWNAGAHPFKADKFAVFRMDNGRRMHTLVAATQLIETFDTRDDAAALAAEINTAAAQRPADVALAATAP